MSPPALDRFDEQAKTILDRGDYLNLTAAIAQAIRAMLPPKGHFLTSDGEVVGPFDSYNLISEAVHAKGVLDCTGDLPIVRRVLGGLPLSADGFVIGCSPRGECLSFPTWLTAEAGKTVIGSTCYLSPPTLEGLFFSMNP